MGRRSSSTAAWKSTTPWRTPPVSPAGASMPSAPVRTSPGSIALTLGFLAVLLATAPLCVLLGLLLLAVSWPFDRDRRLLHAFVCHWCVGYLRLNPGWHVRVEGRE